MKAIQVIKQYADVLRLTLLKNQPEPLLHQAQIDKPTYIEYTISLLEREVNQRQKTDLERRRKLARLPQDHNLNQFDFEHGNGITRHQLKQLRELLWLEQSYNIILMGPSGIGKSFLAAGLISDAVQNGYKAYFMTMEQVIDTLKLKQITGVALSRYNRITKAQLLAIDDIMLFPLDKNDAVAFFNLINLLHQKCSIIITTNKSPKQWAETLDDEVLATALLDRLLYHCQVVKLDGQSYRMKNRKEIFAEHS